MSLDQAPHGLGPASQGTQVMYLKVEGVGEKMDLGVYLKFWLELGFQTPSSPRLAQLIRLIPNIQIH